MRLLKTIGLTLLLVAGMQLCAAAEKQEAFYTGEKSRDMTRAALWFWKRTILIFAVLPRTVMF